MAGRTAEIESRAVEAEALLQRMARHGRRELLGVQRPSTPSPPPSAAATGSTSPSSFSAHTRSAASAIRLSPPPLYSVQGGSARRGSNGVSGSSPPSYDVAPGSLSKSPVQFATAPLFVAGVSNSTNSIIQHALPTAYGRAHHQSYHGSYHSGGSSDGGGSSVSRSNSVEVESTRAVVHQTTALHSSAAAATGRLSARAGELEESAIAVQEMLELAVRNLLTLFALFPL